MSRLSTTVSPWVARVVDAVPTTLPCAFTSRSWVPGVPRRYCSYSSSTPVLPIWLSWEYPWPAWAFSSVPVIDPT